MDRERKDVVIVGAGIVGLSTAFELLQRGRNVLLLDRAAHDSGATFVAAGMLAPASEADLETPALLDFARHSLELYPDFIERVERVSGLRCEYDREGTLWVASRRDDELELEHLARFQAQKGLTTEWLSASEARELEPSIGPRIVSALFAPADHRVDPRRLAFALRTAIHNLGGEVRRDTRVAAVRSRSDDAAEIEGVDTNGDRFHLSARTAVLAPGAWSNVELASPLSPFAVRPVKGQIVRLRGPKLLSRTLRTPHVYIVPRRDGELVIGSSMEERGFDGTPTAGVVMELIRRAFEVLPAIAEFAVSELSVGFRPALRDHLPLIDRVDGCYGAIGHFRNGVLLAPATARHLSEFIESGVRPSALLPFNSQRATLLAP